MATPDTDGTAGLFVAPHSTDSDADANSDADGDGLFILGEFPPLVLEGEGLPEATDDEQAQPPPAAAPAAPAAPTAAAAAPAAVRSGSKVGRKPVNHFHVCERRQQNSKTSKSHQGCMHQTKQGSRKVEFISDTRRRSSAFCKRRDGLTKKVCRTALATATAQRTVSASAHDTHAGTRAHTTVCGAVPARQLRGAHDPALADRLPVHHVERAHAAHRAEPRPPRTHPRRAAAAAAAPVHAHTWHHCHNHHNSNSHSSRNSSISAKTRAKPARGQRQRVRRRAVAEAKHALTAPLNLLGEQRQERGVCFLVCVVVGVVVGVAAHSSSSEARHQGLMGTGCAYWRVYSRAFLTKAG